MIKAYILKLNYKLLALLIATILIVILFGALCNVKTKEIGEIGEIGENVSIATVTTLSDIATVELPIIMYHIILEDSSKINDYIITPTQLEEDLAYIKEQGYTTITTAQLLDFINLGEALPRKPIMITFDDGYETVYHYALPLLQKYGMTAISSILGKQTDFYTENYNSNQLSYSHSPWEQLATMLESGIFELGNHTYDLHSPEGSNRFGTLKNYNESVQDYTQALTSDIGMLNKRFEEMLGFTPNIFAYPYGKISPESSPIIESMGFDIILTCEEKVNILTKGEQIPLYLGRYNRSGYSTTYEFFASFV